MNSIDDIANNDIATKEGTTLPKVTLSFELSRSGLISLTKAEAKMEETYYIEEPVKGSKVKETKTETKASDDQSDTQENAADKEDENQEDKT